jgi:hypothetical protein
MSNSRPWHNTPHLRGRFHPEFPDDLQVIVHEGGPRLTEVQPELMWVKVVGQGGIVYEGELLNAPHNLQAHTLGSHILFLATPGAEHPFLVTAKYLAERKEWKITPCDSCGFPELFDAPSELVSRLFPALETGSQLEGFTTFCPLCGGVQMVQARDEAKQGEGPAGRKWWQVWK